MNGDLLEHVEAHTTFILQGLSSSLCYHDLHHTVQVVAAANILGEKCGLSPHGKEIVCIAAWFHDTGFSIKYSDHEGASRTILREFLTTVKYEREKIREIEDCIAATQMPQHPDNLLQAVLCDADMSHISMDDFLKRLELLKHEWGQMLDQVYDDQRWFHLNFEFLQNHEFLTPCGKKQFMDGKCQNLVKLEKLYGRQSE